VRAQPLADNALTAELAGVPEDDGAVAGEVLVEGHAGRRLAQQPGEPLLVLLERHPAQILAVKLHKVEGAQHRLGSVTLAPDQLEHGMPAIVGDDGLAVDQARAHRQRRDGGHRQREAPGEIVAVAGEQPHAGSVPQRHDAKAVVLDFVQPVRADGRRLGGDGRQGSMKPTVPRLRINMAQQLAPCLVGVQRRDAWARLLMGWHGPSGGGIERSSGGTNDSPTGNHFMQKPPSSEGGFYNSTVRSLGKLRRSTPDHFTA
jgi:hypothetical protein